MQVEKSSAEVRAIEQKAIDDWLPITSSRNAKWWYSAFHNVTAMVGAGVLSLPSAMAALGWFVLLTQIYLLTLINTMPSTILLYRSAIIDLFIVKQYVDTNVIMLYYY